MLQYMPKRVTQEMNNKLMKEVEEEEIKVAISSLHPDKAPGLDAFPICFYQEYWTMIKKYLLKMIRWVMKKAYKIISKFLATRLKPLLPSVISENQGGFLPNRHISDSILLVQEAIHSSLTRKEKGFVLKLDLANAFDIVRHSYLYAILHKMGFDPSFTTMIAACITGPWISPLINGRPCSAFQSSRGLRQGCPLSPYLFILMAESFSQALDYNRRVGLITGIKIEQGAKNINHSQFADDTLLIGGASTTIARRFRKLLDQFMDYSGGKVNEAKSCIYGWNTTNQTIHSIASIFGVPSRLIWNRFSYLGMPVSLGPLKADTWNEILDKIERKVQQWGTMWLNLAGRLILLKSGITSLPIYRFSLYHAPAVFHQKMERVLRHFLWQGGKTVKNKFNLVGWKNIIQTQEKGGLGIRSPRLLNLALGAKIVWRLITGPTTWWKKVLEVKYLNCTREQLLDSNIPKRVCTKIWQLCKKAIPFMRQNISKVPGGGNSINFSNDKILGQQPMGSKEEVIPIITWLNNKGIYHLSQISKWDTHTHAWIGWNLPDSPNVLETSLNALKKLLHSKSLVQEDTLDGYRWDPIGTQYTIKDGHQYLCDNTFQTETWNQWKLVWKVEAPPKVKFFIWLLLKGKTLTTKNLRKRGIMGPSRCPNCYRLEETMKHLFIECLVAEECWKKMASIGESTWESQHTIVETIHKWRKNCPWKEKRSQLAQRVWNTIPFTLLWRIWLARNGKVFQEKGFSIRKICHKAKMLALEAITNHTSGKIDATNYSVEERNFLSYVLENIPRAQETSRRGIKAKVANRGWKLGLKEEEFSNWLSNCNRFCFFFDGTAKSNPGLAGAGGLICNVNGDCILRYEWGLGENSNNRVEGLALFQGLTQLIKLGIKKAVVLGDSSIIIRLMVYRQSTPNILLQQINQRNQILHATMEEVSYYHILRGLNKEVDKHANKACKRPIGSLSCNSNMTLQPLP
eukprot:PITA_04040